MIPQENHKPGGERRNKKMKIDAKDHRIRDPFILKNGGKYYLYGTDNMANLLERDVAGEKNEPRFGFSSYVSDDLITFEGPFHAFDYYEGYDGDKQFWAPEVYALGGKFFMLATFFSTKDNRRFCRFLVSDDPLTGFKPYSEQLTPPDWYSLDGTLFFFRGEPYMFFCHEWLQVHNGEVHAVKLSPDLKQAVGEPKLIFRAFDAKWVTPGTDAVTDAPFVWQLPSGKLVMLWSGFGANGYTVAMLGNDGEDIINGWHMFDKPLFEGNGGHAMLFRDGGRTLMALHVTNIVPDERLKIFAVRETEDRLELAEEVL